MPRRPGPVVGILRHAISLWVMVFFLLAGAIPAMADGWSLSSATGPVFKMEEGAWLEIVDHEPIGIGVPIRTLRGAEAELSSGDVQITLGPESAIRIDSKGATATVISQFGGTVSITVHQRRPSPVILRTQTITVTVNARSAGFTCNATTGVVSVAEGEVTVVDTATGVAAEVGEGSVVSTTDLTGSAGAVTPVSNAKTGNGNANGGNGNSGNNGSGNGGGNNGNGNGNSGGNGNNGNGNGGGNGNGNGNGNGKPKS